MMVMRCAANLNVHSNSQFILNIFGPLVGANILVEDDLGNKLSKTGYWTMVKKVKIKGGALVEQEPDTPEDPEKEDEI